MVKAIFQQIEIIYHVSLLYTILGLLYYTLVTSVYFMTALNEVTLEKHNQQNFMPNTI